MSLNIFNRHIPVGLFIPVLICIATVFFPGCKSRAQPDGLQVIESLTLDSVPSGSGLAVGRRDSLYIIGDDATRLYGAGKNEYQFKGISIASIPGNHYREPKPVKHDFESAAVITVAGTPLLLAFGSGSQTPTRDSVLMVNLRMLDNQVTFSLTAFYDSLRIQTGTDRAMWNIEGSCMTRENLFLANRGNNLLIMLESNAFLAYMLQQGMPMPKAKKWEIVHLPELEGKQARLSGLSTINDSLLLFCASVEDTKDWVSDGPVLGSFIGIYSLASHAVRDCYLLKGDDGKPLKDKLESVEWIKPTDGKPAEIIAIADNDNGSTKLFRIRFPVAIPRK